MSDFHVLATFCFDSAGLLLDSNTGGTVHTKLSEEVIVVRISDIDGLSIERRLNVVVSTVF